VSCLGNQWTTPEQRVEGIKAAYSTLADDIASAGPNPMLAMVPTVEALRAAGPMCMLCGKPVRPNYGSICAECGRREWNRQQGVRRWWRS
jgi:hypothetical protein